MENAIGGYFELELSPLRETIHQEAIMLNSARNGFEYILLARKYNRVWMPDYTCPVMFEPLQKLGIEYELYKVNEALEPSITPTLKADEAFLYTNYFGLKYNCVMQLARKYETQLIVDNAQALFAPPIKGIDTFYSPRKYVGVADGGYVYTDKVLAMNFPVACSWNRMAHLLQRVDLGAERGYEMFKFNDETLSNAPIQKMSKLTQRILRTIDYKAVVAKRKENFRYLHEQLGSKNSFIFPLDSNSVPMVYLYWTDDSELRRILIENRIFVATYWKGLTSKSAQSLVQHLLPLPIDQRYSIADMQRMVECIKRT